MSYSDIKELLHDAKNFATGANDLQLKGILLEIQDKVFELQEENKELRVKLHDLKNEKLLESELEYRNNAYFKKDNKEIAYCSRCYNVEKNLVIMNKIIPSFAFSTTYDFKCPECNRNYDSEILHNKNTEIKF